VLAASTFITACGGGSSAPAGIVLDSQNATDIATSASLFAQASPNIVTSVEAGLPSTQEAIKVLTTLAFDHDRHSTDVVTGVIPGAACSVSGSTSFSGSSSATTRSGTVTFNNCNEGLFVMNGSFTLNSSWTIGGGAFSNSGSGSVTMSVNSASFTLSLDYTSTGDSTTGAFVNDISFTMAITNYGSFSVDTTTAISGNLSTGFTSGVLIVSGGSNTRLRITYNNNLTVTIELDSGNGQFVYHDTI